MLPRSRMKSITVLLSIFGTSPYLTDFLKSLKNQSCQDFQLFYRFDGKCGISKDILSHSIPDLMCQMNETHCGVVKSYGTLIADAPETDYYMFADQDDVWHTDKIEVSLKIIKETEAYWGKDIPILVHSDLNVVGPDLSLISNSFVHYQSLKPCRKELKDVMIQNNVTGCTVIFNRALRGLAHIPDDAICHDWYLAMIAAALGKIVFCDKALIEYRQHSSNCYGAVQRKKLIAKFFQRKNLHGRIQLTQRQAKAFAEQFGSRLSEEQRHILKTWYENLSEPNYWKRLNTVLRAGFRKNDLLRTMGMWWAV